MPSNAMRFEKLLEAVPDALVGMDQKGVIRFVNGQTESLFGYERSQLIGEYIDILVPETLWQIYAQHQQDYFADPRTRSSGLDLELSGRHHDGGEFPINVSLSHIDTGDVLLVITGVAEVTRHQQAVRNAGLIEAIVEYSEDAIISSTLNGTITSWNPAAERMYGYSSREIIGRSGLLLVPDDRVDEENLMAGLKAGHHVGHLETARVRKDGTVIPVSVNAAPICDEAGTIVGVSAAHRDVTEQRQAFDAAQRLAAIVENSDDAIIGKTLERIITSWNPAAARMFGYSAEEIVGRSTELLTPEDRAAEATADVARIRAGQHVEHLETSRVRKDGTAFPASITLSPIRNADGVIVGASVICRDTTEQEQAARALAETSWRYRLLAENASDLVVMASPDRVMTWVSPSVTRTLGWSTEELVGTRLVDLMHPDDVAATAKAREEVYSGHRPATPEGGYVMRFLAKSGQYRWMSGSATPVTDEAGANVGVVAGLRDVHDLVRAREEAQRLAAIVENSDEAIVGSTLEGIVVSWNPAAERMFGYSSAELVGKSASRVLPGDRADEMKALGAKIKAGQPVERLETIRVHKDGTAFPVSVTISPIRDKQGAITGVSAITRAHQN